MNKQKAQNPGNRPCQCGCVARQHYQWRGSCAGCDRCAAFRERPTPPSINVPGRYQGKPAPANLAPPRGGMPKHPAEKMRKIGPST